MYKHKYLKYKQKYLKYKQKYLNYKQMIGGSEFSEFSTISLYEFIIDSDDMIINLIPTRCYDIVDDKSYIIFYRIILRNKLTDEIIEEAEIPYYMSDGNTNKLRAGLLFPFISFNYCKEKNIKYEYPNSMCTSSYSNRLKFKHELLYNLNFDIYQNTKLTENYTNLLALIKSSVLIRSSSIPSYDEDLLSVLPRIGNFLDFIIGAYNKIIMEEFKNDLDTYSSEIKLNNFSFCKKYQPLINTIITSDIYNITKENDIDIDKHNEYRYRLLNLIYYLMSNFIDYNFLTVIPTNINIQTSSKDQYRKEIYPLCENTYTSISYTSTSDRPDLSISRSLHTYVKISTHLHNIMKEKFKNLREVSVNYNMTKCQSIVMHWLNYIVIDQNNIEEEEYNFIENKSDLSRIDILQCINKSKFINIFSAIFLNNINYRFPRICDNKDCDFNSFMSKKWNARCKTC
jgi:hypothetical protein